MARSSWVVKSEPRTYAWEDLVRDGETRWDGIRNFEARNHLRAMKRGDLALFYHSGPTQEVVGVARITRAAYPDPTAAEGDWSAVDLAPQSALEAPVALATLRAVPDLARLALLTRPRLSVTPIGARELRRILALGARRR